MLCQFKIKMVLLCADAATISDAVIGFIFSFLSWSFENRDVYKKGIKGMTIAFHGFDLGEFGWNRGLNETATTSQLGSKPIDTVPRKAGKN